VGPTNEGQTLRQDRRTQPAFAALLTVVAVAMAVAVSGCATSGRDRLPSLGVAELAEGEQVVRLRLESYFFEPNRLRVRVGIPVRMILENGTLFRGHDFSLFAPEAGLEINAFVPARQQITVQFVPQRVGEFTFYCNIGDHAERGMSGTLEVVSGR
jgi:uncharacterized cupredoxin-like copper-binding protein